MLNLRNVLFAGVALTGVASAAPRLHPVHNADGSVEVSGKLFPSTHAYLTSPEFRASGARCGTDRVPVMSPVISQSDCSDRSTTINQDYFDGRTLVIQVVVHVVSNSSGTGNVTDTQVQSQIDILNQDYQALANSHGAPGTDAKVKFVLARFDPMGHPTNGIDRVTNNTYFTEGDAGTSAMKTALHWDPAHYLNIYSNDLDSQGLLGYATFPQESAGMPTDGVVLAYQSVGLNPAYTPYDLGASATHEIGHYFGLYHTFEDSLNGNSSTEGCGTTAAPYTSGDTISDTNREKTANYDCAPVASGCNDNMNSPIENYMDYSKDSCMTTFTPEQTNRVRCGIMTWRYVNTEPTVGFTFTSAALVTTFTDASTDAESQAAQMHYNWDFGDGMTSTDENPVHTYAAAGSYDVTLEVVDPGSASAISKQTVVVAATGGNGSGSNNGGGDAGLGGGADDDGNGGGGCCQAPRGGLGFMLCGVPVAFVLLRRRRRSE